MTKCCGYPQVETSSGTRCSGCGHRQTVNGVRPKQTRDIMKSRPSYLFTELRGRAQAKYYGRNQSNLNSEQFN